MYAIKRSFVISTTDVSVVGLETVFFKDLRERGKVRDGSIVG